MKTLSDAAGQQLYIVQPSVFKRYFEILFDEEVVGTLIFPKWYSVMPEVNFLKGKWILYKPSLWKSTVEIKEHNRQLPFSKYVRTSFKSEGVVELPRGQRLKISFKPFKGLCEIHDIRNKKLVSIKQNVSFKQKSEIAIELKSELLDKYPWVIILAWHLFAQQRSGRKH